MNCTWSLIDFCSTESGLIPPPCQQCEPILDVVGTHNIGVIIVIAFLVFFIGCLGLLAGLYVCYNIRRRRQASTVPSAKQDIETASDLTPSAPPLPTLLYTPE